MPEIRLVEEAHSDKIFNKRNLKLSYTRLTDNFEFDNILGESKNKEWSFFYGTTPIKIRNNVIVSYQNDKSYVNAFLKEAASTKKKIKEDKPKEDKDDEDEIEKIGSGKKTKPDIMINPSSSEVTTNDDF